MREQDEIGRRRLQAAACVAALTVALTVSSLASAASSDDDESYSTPGWSDKISDSIKESINGATRKMGLNKQMPPPPESPSGCPTINILPGTESQRVSAPGTTGNQGLRYQYSLMNVGRECSLASNRVTLKVGVEGRVLLGPAGTSGHYDVPIRVAIFSEAQQKPVESKLFKVPVSIGAGQAGAPFNFVSDALTFAVLQGKSTDYSIKVGFDAGKGGGPGDAAAKPKHARRHKPSTDTASASQ